MFHTIKVLKEVKDNFIIMHRLALNDLIIQNKGNALGILWLWINPTIQIVIYGVIFGMGLRGNAPVEGVNFFLWLIPGFIMWNYINNVVTVGSRSIVVKMGIVTKMRFPVSIIPGIVVLSELYLHIMMVITIAIIMVVCGIPITYYCLQIPYYMFAAVCFLFAVSVFNSAITTVIRDYQHIVYNIMRTMFFITPVIFPVTSMKGTVMKIVFQLNPLTYLLEGYRDAFVYQRMTTLNSVTNGVYFWVLVFVFLISGSLLHIKMRKNLLDYA